MPELPEVETIRRALENGIVGQTITQVEVFSPRLRTSLEPLKSAPLVNRTIAAARRRGRYLVLDLDGGLDCLLIHLGMSGVIRVEAPGEKRKHEHLFLHLSGGQIFKFECVRRFSVFEYWPLSAPGAWPECLQKLGVEPLSDDFTANYLFACSRRRIVPVKTFIMDNAVVTGVGNIYANESLFAARLNPAERAANLTRKDCEILTNEIKKVLTKALRFGGTTFSAYKHIDGSEGLFEQELQIYGHKNGLCPVCGERLSVCRLGGRSCFYCPKCQKLKS